MTVQNHSSYTRGGFPSTIHLEGLSRDYPDVEQYLSLLRLSDEAIKEMISFFEETGEPTVVVFFGDHQPSLSQSFLKEISKGVKHNNRFCQKNNLFAVPYFIWSNFDLQGEEVSFTSTNYMQLNLLKSLGMELTPFQRLLSDLQEQVPVLNAFGYQGKNGKCYEHGDQSSPYYELVQEYFCLCYNYVMGGEERVEDFF